ncbi:MAG: iron ABC transporter permease [Bdellovibrionales bacterium]|nr:iron ABC transporter permease [Bdellovibrionales bacterium]
MKKTVLGLSIFILLVLCVYPFLELFLKVIYSGPGGTLSFDAFNSVLTSDTILTAVKNTLLVSTAVSLLSCLVGIPLAWLLSRTDFPWNRRFRSWLCLPYAIPPYIGAIAWIFLANPTTGLLNRILGHSFLNVYTFSGLVWIESSFLYTFILLTVHASLERMDSSFEEAARLSGAGPLKIFKDITLPLIRPSILGGGLLVFLATAASFGVPALIGSPARIYLITTQIYTFQKMGSMSGIYRAGALSMLLLFSAAVTLLIQQRILRKSQFQTVSGKSSRPSLIELGKWKTPSVILVCAFLFLVFILPLSGVFISALSKVQGEFSFDNWTFSNFYRVLFETQETGRAFWNSFSLGVIAATLACLLGAFLSYIQVKTKLKGRNLLDLLASLPYSTPGTVVALALILAFSNGFFGVGPSLYNTLGMLALAYIVKYLSFAMKTTADGYRQIDDVLDEASRVSGAGWGRTMLYIWLPLMKAPLVAAWFLIFMPVVSELTMTILLTGPGLETVGTVIFQLQEYADASGGSASVLAILVVMLVVLVNWIVKKSSDGRYGL